MATVRTRTAHGHNAMLSRGNIGAPCTDRRRTNRGSTCMLSMQAVWSRGMGVLLACMMGGLACMIGVIESMIGVIECMIGVIECMMVGLACMMVGPESMTGVIERMIGVIASMIGVIECMIGVRGVPHDPIVTGRRAHHVCMVRIITRTRWMTRGRGTVAG